MLVDYSVIDTSPGQHPIFSPPSGFEGTDQAYLKLMRERMSDMGFRQQIMVGASIFKKMKLSLGGDPVVSGPYKDQAEYIISTLSHSAENTKKAA